MGILDEFRKFTRPYTEEDDYEDELDDEGDDYGAEEPEPMPERPSRRSTAAPSYASSSAMDTGRSGSKVLSMRTTPQLQVFVVNSINFENASEVAKHLLEKQAVLLNLENTDKSTGRRLVDFLSGCAYALDGEIKKVATSTYLITPTNVEIVGDLVEEMEKNGMYL